MSALHLRHRLKKGRFSLDVDCQVPMTGVTGVFGESGSGKTTLLRCIAGLEESGSDDTTPVHKRRIGYVFQEPQLFGNLNVRGNIEYGRRRSVDHSAVIRDVVSMLEIDNLLDRDVHGLSGGEAQRVSIARVLCQSPRLILMDEPLSALDVRRRDEVLPYLERLHAESAVPIVYVSHNIDEICRLSDYLLILDQGKIVANGELQSTLLRTDLPQLQGSNAGAVIEASTVSYDAADHLTCYRFSAGDLWAPGRHDASTARLRISANDVSLCREAPESSTILNVLPATITEMRTESAATSLVQLHLGDDYLVARITKRSARHLGLRVGESIFAQIKSVTVRR